MPPQNPPLEPWPGYAQMSRADRRAMFKAKEQEARKNNDQAYALALAAAVANYEHILKLEQSDDHDDDMSSAAGDLHGDAGSWRPN